MARRIGDRIQRVADYAPIADTPWAGEAFLAIAVISGLSAVLGVGMGVVDPLDDARPHVRGKTREYVSL
ncbi:hypothetical protein [Amycolatopsis sp. FDAARGOS 1241]|uniref:hypothetical protein n=1 Tax=Amycolatopsis sp. FDAARGOS 1241 TaxID=2778070 RepID=UPI00194F1D48|nr:hypothetical protein [Amycolatopsis sp. FDAARGOS 1241]QRP48566.1 hypothetical protein I6J71_12410 [Amycolatopsis sp. FDAARGOS 1241]